MNSLELTLAVVFHPVDTFTYIKSRQKPLNYIFCTMLLLMVVVVHIISMYITHFPVAAVQPRDANIWMESLKLIIPVITWVIACYGVTAINDGETKLGEMYAAAVYSMIPYIICTIPIALLTSYMGRDELKLYNTLQILVWIWVLATYFLSVKTLNDYTLGKTIRVCVISIIAMFLVWGVVMLIFALTSQLSQFIKDITLEFKMLFIK